MNLKSALVWAIAPMIWLAVIALTGASKSTMILSGIFLVLLTVVAYGLLGVGKALDEWERNSIEE